MKKQIQITIFGLLAHGIGVIGGVSHFGFLYGFAAGLFIFLVAKILAGKES